MTTATEERSAYTGEQLAQYANKRVKFVHNLDEANEKGEKAVEVEGTVQTGNELGLLVKPKGQVSFKIFHRDSIEPDSITLVEDKSTKLKRSKLQPVKIGQARRHLLERHGFTLSYVNGLTEEQAMKVHDEIDHEMEDLGHVHVAESEGESKDESDS